MEMEINSLTKLLRKLLKDDSITYEHCVRVCELTKIITPYLDLSDSQKNNLILGCLIHDIGKKALPHRILYKAGALSSKEWDVIKNHTLLGTKIAVSQGIVDEEVLGIIKYHHERWDGLGYPLKLEGNDIPVLARICSIIDAFDCMISDRTYSKAIPINKAKEELHNHSGSQFDQFYVQIFLDIPDHNLKVEDSGLQGIMYG